MKPLQKLEVIREATRGFGASRLIGMSFAVRKKNGMGRWWVDVLDVRRVSESTLYVKVGGNRSAGKPWWVPIESLEVH